MTSAIGRFLKHEAAGGVLLIGGALIALIAANSVWSASYASIWSTPFTLGFGEWALQKPVLLWINDGLMAVFFLLVGLELKRELLTGELADPRKAALPVFAAIGGIVLPGLIYAMVVGGGAGMSGWAIPVATDIAFVLAILLLMGSRVPIALKVFLTGVVIIDDIAAIAIIAFFYSGKLDPMALGIAALFFGSLAAMARFGVRRLVPYAVVGVAMWFAVLLSGLHATLAGVMLAATIPLGRPDDGESPLERLEHGLHPWVAFGVLPLFALANAGVVLEWPESVTGGAVTLGVLAGLLIGKPVGILGFSWVSVRMGWAVLPRNTSWAHILGIGMLCGIGFTMSLFIGALAFTNAALVDASKIGIMGASAISAMLGVAVLLYATRPSVEPVVVFPVRSTPSRKGAGS